MATALEFAVQSTARAARLPAGRIWHRASGDLEYFVFIPKTAHLDAPPLVAVHGISRNADEHARAFAPYAEKAGVVLVAPVFDESRYRGFQRLAARRQPGGAGLALRAIIAEVRAETGCRANKINLFGYSGGGQFSHRFAMAWPAMVRRVAVASAGWYTLPYPDLPFPAGLQAGDDQPWSTNARELLSVPLLVAVGDRDTRRDDNFRSTPHLDAEQGLTRVARAHHFANAMRNAQAAAGLPDQVELRLLRGVGHSFADCMVRGKLGAHLFNFFFNDPQEEISRAGVS